MTKRIRTDDHGAYCFIILLCMHFDNGRIFSMELAKRMTIELSTLAIYSHTLRYHFQDKKNYDRYQVVLNDNPLAIKAEILKNLPNFYLFIPLFCNIEYESAKGGNWKSWYPLMHTIKAVV